MQKRKNGQFNLSNNQVLIAVIVFIFLATTGLLGGIIELVVGVIGLFIGLFVGLIGLVVGLLPIIIPIVIVVAILKTMNRSTAKQKNDFV